MTIWYRLRAYARRLRRPAAWDGTLDDELRAYLDQDIDARIASGRSPAEARRIALAELGGLEPVKEQVRAGAAGAWIDVLGRDVRYACRALLQARGFTAWVVASLAMGMAVAIAALGFLNALLFRPFPAVVDQERLVRVAVSRNCGRPDCWIRMASTSDYAALRDGLAGLQGLAAYSVRDLSVSLPDARSMRGVVASPGYFEVLGISAAPGRTFGSADENRRAAVAVISHRLWTRELGADPSVIGQSIRVAGEIVEIVGVAPQYFVGIDLGPRNPPPDIWLPIWMADQVSPLTRAEQRRQQRDLAFVGRLRDGIEAPQVEAAAAAMARQLAATRSPGTDGGRAEIRRVWRVNPEHRLFSIIVVAPIPILVLVIACVNAASLMLARGSQRQQEIAIRLAIGAGRGRIVRQLLVESAVLAFVATAVAAPIAWWGLELTSTPLHVPIPLDPVVLVSTVATAALTTLVFGLVPALRISAQRPSMALGSAGGRGDAMPRQSRLRRALVVVQVALSLGLLATAWQLVATVQAQTVSSGTRADRLLIARFDLGPLNLHPADGDAFYRRLLDGARQLPGVEAAGLARNTSVWTFGQGAASGSVLVWQEQDRPDEARTIIGGYAGGDLVEALGLRVLQGRSFTDADVLARPQVAVVNQPFADTISGPAIGSVLRVAPRDRDFASSIEVRIVGVIEAMREPRQTPDDRPSPRIYLPSPIEAEPALALYLRTSAGAGTAAQPLRDLVRQIDPRVPALDLGSLAEISERSYGAQLWLARAAALLGAIGLLLATAGLYGVTSYVVAMRSREIAIRMALGARPGLILSMVLGQSMRVVSIGLLTGGGAAIVASRMIQAGYHGIQGLDPLAFGGAVGLFLAAMAIASALPAIRASRVDPVQNLKDA